MYSLSAIASIVEGKLQGEGQRIISFLGYDSRKLSSPDSSLFIALEGEHQDGHAFVQDAYSRGVRSFLVRKEILKDHPDVSVIVVPDTLEALHQLAAHHRKNFSYPVIGITGSNGKTIVKEWLYQLLSPSFKIVRSPRSYNSQLGVPLSVWQMTDHHELGIFEAGISRPGEMDSLQRIIDPDIGVITNLGDAHSKGFNSPAQKLEEKLLLFRNAGQVVGPFSILQKEVPALKLTWGQESEADLRITAIKRNLKRSQVGLVYKGESFEIEIPFTDEASVNNAVTCFAVCILLKADLNKVIASFPLLHAVDMRLQLNHGINNCLVVNDSYISDLTSLRIALDFVNQQSRGYSKTLILSPLENSDEKGLLSLLRNYKVDKHIWIGEGFPEPVQNMEVMHFKSTEEFLNNFKTSQFNREVILIKGSRKYGFERIASLFEQKQHQTLLQINLNHLIHNVNEYRRLLNPGTRIMAMVKAFAYGSGGAEIASALQENNVHYLGVAYVDEGAELVRSGIRIPIMVMNVDDSSFRSLVDNNLEPVLYSNSVLNSFSQFLKEQGLSQYPVHLEIETGMNRLGFRKEEISTLAENGAFESFHIKSVFSHLVASEDKESDSYTMEQAQRFNETVQLIKRYVTKPFLSHISNSAAIIRHPQLQMDMVRIGIGMYGVEIHNGSGLELLSVPTLKSTVAQLHLVKKGESVSYNRKGTVSRDSIIATVRIGYADGYSRRFGNGMGKMLIKGELAPVIGTVCMDMTMVDVTDIPGVEEGEEVIIFGPSLPVQQVASWIGTISYELLSGISQRVKRVYYYE